MLFAETGGTGTSDLDDLVVFASQLEALGHRVHIDPRSLPDGLRRTTQFDLAPFLHDGAPARSDRVAVLGAGRIADEALVRLRRLAGREPPACVAFAHFSGGQARIGAQAKLSYVFGRDPAIFELPQLSRPDVTQTAPLIGVPRRSPREAPPRLLVVAPDLTDPRQAAALVALALARQFRTSVLTDAKSKAAWAARHGHDVTVYQYSEVLPAALAGRVDICAVFRPLMHYYRFASLAANVAATGGVLIDGTPRHGIAAENDAFVRGPIGLAELGAFLKADILPNLDALAAETRRSAFADRVDPGPVLAALGLAPQPPAPAAEAPLRVAFMPTNGVGLGHARRCTLIAAELDPAIEATFAAFPSCAALIRSRGFDTMPLVARSADHAQSHENDLPNYLRLRGLAAGARALVFDGGYVFDSVYRTILERGLRGVWIRRGLWQAFQDNSLSLDREKVFDRVVVPREAFDELNVPYSRGPSVHEVGPVVQRVDLGPDQRQALRERLAHRYGLAFDRLVVTLLGGGVAADRSPQIQAICGMMERRSDVLHLVVAWPGGVLLPAWFSWSRSRVVATVHAGILAAASDLCIGAAGYNSFHEALYNAVPTIFLPQTNAYLDDQPARARAARERGLAALVEPGELMTLEREIARHIDDGEAAALRLRLAALDLPEPGNAQAATLIEEVIHGDAALARTPLAHRPARRG